MVEHGADLAHIDNTGLSVAGYTLEQGSIGIPVIISYLLSAGISFGALKSPYHHCLKNRKDCIPLLELVQRTDNYDINEHNNKHQQTTLHLAIKNQWQEVAQWLIDHGADIDAQDINGMTPLHVATKAGYTDGMVLLIKQGASLETKSTHGYTPLFLTQNLAGMQLLLNHGANINSTARGYNFLHVLFLTKEIEDFKDFIARFKLALQAGISINDTTPSGATILHIVINSLIESKIQQYIELLIQNGIDVNQRDHNGRSAMHCAVQTIDVHKAINILKTLQTSECLDLSATDKRGNTAIHICVATWSIKDDIFKVPPIELIEYLQANGVDINAINRYQATASDCIQADQDKDWLIQLGATNGPQTEKPPFHLSITEKTPQTVETPNSIPSTLAFNHAVRSFKKYYGMKSIKELHDPTNPAQTTLLQRFYSHPVISAYLTRTTINFDRKYPILESKYERHFYCDTTQQAELAIPYRIFVNNISDDARPDESGTLTPRPKFWRFYHTGRPQCAEPILMRRLLRKITTRNKAFIAVKRLKDVYQVGNFCRELEQNQTKRHSDYSHVFIAMPSGKEDHAVAYFAIFDTQKSETVAIFLCNSWQDTSYFASMKQRINMGSAENNPIPIIDASHQLQVEADDGNCGLYTYDFCQAFIDVITNNSDIRKLLTTTTRQQLLNSPESRTNLGSQLRTAMKPYLAHLYDSPQARANYFLQLRWEIGNDHIRELASLEKPPASQQDTLTPSPT